MTLTGAHSALLVAGRTTCTAIMLKPVGWGGEPVAADRSEHTDAARW